MSSPLTSHIQKTLTGRLSFFGEVVGALMIDAVFLGVWAVIHYLIEVGATRFSTQATALSFKILKYTFDFSTLTVIAMWVIGDVIRTLRKIIRSLKQEETV